MNTPGLNELKLNEYFERIALSAPSHPTLSALVDIHFAQASHIPFENLDVLLGRGVSLDPNLIFDKLVHRKRGGYCFELNGLFALALEAIGFQVERLLARVSYNRASPGPKSHEVLLVSVGKETWLADVGFGGPGLRAPLLFEPGHSERIGSEEFKLIRDDRFGYALQRMSRGEWQDLYSFTREAALPVDYIMSNFYTSTWPESHFRSSIVLSILTSQGRITMKDWMLTIFEGSSVIEEHLTADESFSTALVKHFGLHTDIDPRKIAHVVPCDSMPSTSRS